MNKGNLDFYSRMELQKFEEFANMLGLDTAKDVKEAYPHIQHFGHLVELGAGYGRVVQALLDLGYKGKITAVEQVPRLVDELKSRFGDRIDVLRQDVAFLDLPEKVDCIIWFWSGILELDQKEQLAAIKQCYKLLNDNGLLLVEVPYGQPKKVGESDGEKIRVETAWGVLEAYVTGHEEIDHFYHEAGFKSLRGQTYQTETDLTRIFYLFRK